MQLNIARRHTAQPPNKDQKRFKQGLSKAYLDHILAAWLGVVLPLYEYRLTMGRTQSGIPATPSTASFWQLGLPWRLGAILSCVRRVFHTSPQIFQTSLIKECTLNHIGILHML